MTDPEIFDRDRRRLRRDRAARDFDQHAFLIDQIGASLLDRLDLVRRPFAHALDLGCHDGRLGAALRARGMAVTSVDAGAAFAHAAGGIQCDEDRLPFASESFDLIVSAGVLDQVNDLPGALVLARRMLRPDGLFLAGFAGAGSLAVTRAALLAADIASGRGVAARIHPQIDVRAAGDLLGRAGFVLTVADSERLDIRYRDPLRIFADLRGMAATRLLRDPAPPLTRADLAVALDAYGPAPVTETFELVFMTGWSPGPDQPRPARRGSATTSLAGALGRR